MSTAPNWRFDDDQILGVAVAAISKSDIACIAAIEAESNTPPWSEALFRNELDNRYATLLGGYLRGDLLGFILYHAFGNEGHILKVGVLQQYRGRGIGHMILQETLVRMRGVGIKWISLEVRSSNVRAQSLYAEFGFVSAGVRQRYYSDNQEDALIMRLDVQNYFQTSALFSAS